MTSPISNAGPDQLNVEPWSIVALSGSDSDPDGTIVSRSWLQTAGVTVTLIGTGNSRIFETPGTIAGTTLTFRYRVTDNNNNITDDFVNIQVRPVTMRAVINGAEQPLRMTAAISANFLTTENSDIITLETGDPILV